MMLYLEQIVVKVGHTDCPIHKGWKQSPGKRPDLERMSQQAFSPRHYLDLIPGIVVAIATGAYRKFKRSFRAVCRVGDGRTSAGSDANRTLATGISA
jgi:hypothetical protein